MEYSCVIITWIVQHNQNGGSLATCIVEYRQSAPPPIFTLGWQERGGGGRINDGGHSDGTLRYMNMYMSSASSNNYKWHTHVYMQVCNECYHTHSELVL